MFYMFNVLSIFLFSRVELDYVGAQLSYFVHPSLSFPFLSTFPPLRGKVCRKGEGMHSKKSEKNSEIFG